MTVKELLLERAKIGDIVIFREGGWQIGMTRIDNDGFFIQSLSTWLLCKDVRHYEYADRDWTSEKVLVVDIW